MMVCTLYTSVRIVQPSEKGKHVHRMQMDLIAFSILTKYFNYIKKQRETSLTERIKHRHMKKKPFLLVEFLF